MAVNKIIDSGKSFDWGNTSKAYAKYRDIYPPFLYDKLREFGVSADGTSWLDLGTGTGILPLNLYNPKADITGADISAQQIFFAQSAAAEKGYNISFIVSPAENLPFPDNSFDVICAAQCFWYFEKEKTRAEIKRLIKPNGKFIKIVLDWAYDDEISAKSITLVKKHNPLWEPQGLATEDMFDDLFEGRKTEIYSLKLAFERENWHGRMCACRGTLASMDAETFKKWSEEHIKMLENYPEKFEMAHKLYISIFEF